MPETKHIRITIEKVESTYICTALDEIGVVATSRGYDKDKMLSKCKQKTIDAFECEVVFNVEDLYGC